MRPGANPRGAAWRSGSCDFRCWSSPRLRAAALRRRLSEPPGARHRRLLARDDRRPRRARGRARMGQILGQQIVVENRPGAGSSIAAEYVARAPKDGYTLLMATVANTINAVVISTLPFDFRKDLAPIALVANVPNVLVVHPSIGVSSVQGADRARQGEARAADLCLRPAPVRSAHLSGELLNIRAGVKLVHVPYPGSPQGVTDLLAGRVQRDVLAGLDGVASMSRPDRLKALATTETKRAAIAPDLPTMAEAGLPGYDTGIWIGLLAPAGTSREVDRQARERAQRRAQGRRGAHRVARPERRAARRQPGGIRPPYRDRHQQLDRRRQGGRIEEVSTRQRTAERRGPDRECVRAEMSC